MNGKVIALQGNAEFKEYLRLAIGAPCAHVVTITIGRTVYVFAVGQTEENV